MKFNEKLTKLRKMEGLSQEELGYRLNVTRQTVSKWELGQTTPEMDKLVEIGKIFNISVDDLLNDSEVQSAKTVINEKKSTEENVQQVEKQESVKENVVNQEEANENSYKSTKNDKHKRDMCIMIILGILFVITLALVISKGYEMVREKFEALNPKEEIAQIEDESREDKNLNEITNKIKETNSVKELDETNIISQVDETNTVKENSNTVEQLNPNNSNNSFLILETINQDGKRYVDTDGGKVINTTHYATDNAPSLRRCLSIKSDSIKPLTNKIYKLINICRNWLDVTDSEFILDPDYYVIT